MAIKTALLIGGDASQATAALNETDQALAKNAEQAKRLADAYAQADKAIDRVAAAQQTAKAATAQHQAALAAGEITEREYNARLLETKTALGLVENEHRQATAAIKQAQAALGSAPGATRAAEAGYVNLGRQMQDVWVQLQSGTNLGTIIAQQGGQVADAVAQMGGRFAGFAAFMSGPWGAAITVGIGVLVNLIEQMWLASEASDANADSFKKVEAASSGLASAQQALGEVFDLTTGKIKSQNDMLILNARLMAVNLRAEALSERTNASKTFGNFAGGGLGLSTGKKVLGALGVPVYGDTGREAAVRQVAQGVVSGKLTPEAALRASEKLDFSGLAVSKTDFQQAIINRVSSGLKDQTAALIDKSLDDKSLAAGLRKTATAHSKKTPKPKSGSTDEFAEDTAARIARLRDQFTDVPAQVQKVNAAMRQLDDLASDVERKKPPNYKELLGDISALKPVIQDALNKPLDDFLEKSRASAEVDKLLLAGKDDEAAALRVILQLKDQMGPLDDAQMEAVLATVRAERERSMVLRDQRALIQANVNAVYDMRSALEQTVAQMFRGKFSLGAIISSIGQSYVNIMSQRLVEGLFGDALRQLEDQASGVGKVDAAGTKMASSLGKGAEAVDSFAETIRAAIRKIDPAVNLGGSRVGGVAGIDDATKALSGGFAKFLERQAAKAAGGGVPDTVGGEIVVSARTKAGKKVDASGTGELMIDAIDKFSTVVLGRELPKAITEPLKALFKGFEQSLPQILAGAFAGKAASNLILGGGGSSAGGAIGGILGQKFGEKFLQKGLSQLLPGLGQFAGPLGAIAGGLLGGVIGGLFKKTQWGAASVSNGKVSSSGNKADFTSGANSAGGTVSSAIEQIAQRLGGVVGDYAVSIGLTNGNWNVNPNAISGKIGTKWQRDTVDFKKDQGAALSWAIGNAIGDGAIKGVSAAVQKALKSSSDVDKAIAEALKVQDVELALGGIGAEMEKAFRQFQQQAEERLRIARQYGFDVVKLEERNAADRLKLSQKLIEQQVGSLQSLIDEMTSGSLFEGSAVDRRNALLGQIAATRADANAGVDGAADKLAKLLEQLNDVSKDAYGTTGGFAQDRSLILDQARETIAAANQRVADAQAKVESGVAATNAALDENNDQNAQMIAALGLNNELLTQIAAANAGTGNPVYSRLTSLAATS